MYTSRYLLDLYFDRMNNKLDVWKKQKTHTRRNWEEQEEKESQDLRAPGQELLCRLEVRMRGQAEKIGKH